MGTPISSLHTCIGALPAPVRRPTTQSRCCVCAGLFVPSWVVEQEQAKQQGACLWEQACLRVLNPRHTLRPRRRPLAQPSHAIAPAHAGQSGTTSRKPSIGDGQPASRRAPSPGRAHASSPTPALKPASSTPLPQPASEPVSHEEVAARVQALLAEHSHSGARTSYSCPGLVISAVAAPGRMPRTTTAPRPTTVLRPTPARSAAP